MGRLSRSYRNARKRLQDRNRSLYQRRFKSFPKLIDALGGVTLKIEPYEAEYINRTTTQIDKIQSGDAVKLNGAQALVYTVSAMSMRRATSAELRDSAQ